MIHNIGDKIRYLRDKSGYTQTYLAKRLGISRSAVNSWEMSLSMPSVGNIVEMSNIFHVSTDYLLSNDEKIMLDITPLSNDQREIVIKLVSCLNDANSE
ncbi:MAG: helix-turn-helix transcriptional regulator [Clostridia bacterium]|nr:helix-turn-helix transcriptional regulator [Clostridia bacterium]